MILVGDTEPREGLVEQLQQWCKATLQYYQYPHVVDFVDDFPADGHGEDPAFQAPMGHIGDYLPVTPAGPAR